MRALTVPRLFAVFLISALLTAPASAQSLTKDAAVALAQRFIVENGYTDLPLVKMQHVDGIRSYFAGFD